MDFIHEDMHNEIACSDCNCVQHFLTFLYGDIYKLLPMKEEEIVGLINTVDSYMESLIIVLIGALELYPMLKKEKKYLYTINSIEYLRNNASNVDFAKWRKTVLKSTTNIEELSVAYGG